MTGLVGSAGTPPLVILSGGWSGDAMLVRLLAASGHIRVLGRVLERPWRRPLRSLSRFLRPGHALLVHPTDLWFHNAVDQDDFDEVTRRAGAAVIALARHRLQDAALSQALCDSPAEVLPRSPRHVTPAEVVVRQRHAARALDWVSRASVQLRFEDDLAGLDSRDATVRRLAGLLDLMPWRAPWEEHPPTHENLWAAVVNGGELATALERIEHALVDAT